MTSALQIIKFAGVGGAATLLHVTVALICSSLLNVAPQAANFAGFTAAIALSYFGQGRVTFATTLRHSFHGPRFLATALAGLAMSSTVTHIIVSQMGAPFALAMALVAVMVPVTTFALCKLWVFKDHPT